MANEQAQRTGTDAVDLDLGTVALFVGFAVASELQREVSRQGFADVRFSHNDVFHHLVDAEPTITDLAGRLDITQQGASKIIVELERADYVHRIPDGDDARVRRVRLTGRGQGVVDAYRDARRQVELDLAERHGPERVQLAREVLVDILEGLGGADAVRRRDVRLPS